MTVESVQVDGFSELNDLLLMLPLAIEKKLLRGALRAGQKVILAEARMHCPVDEPPQQFKQKYGSYAGALRDSLRISTRLDKRNGQIVSTLRAGDKKSFYARWVEFPTARHIIRAHNGKALTWGGAHATWVLHPGTKGNPFMRNAFDAKYQEALTAVADYLRPRITKEIAKLPNEDDS